MLDAHHSTTICGVFIPRRHQPKKLATRLKIQNPSQSGLVKQEWQWWFSWKQISRPISREDYFCGLSKEEIKRESIWRLKDRVNSHDRESLKTALPYRWFSTKHTPTLQMKLNTPFSWTILSGDDLVSRKYIILNFFKIFIKFIISGKANLSMSSCKNYKLKTSRGVWNTFFVCKVRYGNFGSCCVSSISHNHTDIPCHHLSHIVSICIQKNTSQPYGLIIACS